MNNTTTSKRMTRTKEQFKLALIQLIKKQGYHCITVKDLVNEAAYNRSTFYVHYQDKQQLTDDLMQSMFRGLEESVSKPYITGQHLHTSKIGAPSFNIVQYIYENRHFFELMKYEDTIPSIHTAFPQTILKIYNEQFAFETINNLPVNMDFFKRYTAFGFYGLLENWIINDFRQPIEEFIEEVILLSRTHIASFQYLGLQNE